MIFFKTSNHFNFEDGVVGGGVELEGVVFPRSLHVDLHLGALVRQVVARRPALVVVVLALRFAHVLVDQAQDSLRLVTLQCAARTVKFVT